MARTPFRALRETGTLMWKGKSTVMSAMVPECKSCGNVDLLADRTTERAPGGVAAYWRGRTLGV